MDNALVLIIENASDYSEVLEISFNREGFRTATATDGGTGLDHHLRMRPDLVVLDVRLPMTDGYEVLAAIRRRGETPVLVATALTQDRDKLQAFRIGADDYVVKPVNPLEVVARAKAILRRTCKRRAGSVIRVGRLSVDPRGHEAVVDLPDGRKALDLTRTEFRLLAHMARSPNRVFERGELLGACLRENEAVERTVDSHISHLRRKLTAAGADGVVTGVRGVGYRVAEN